MLNVTLGIIVIVIMTAKIILAIFMKLSLLKIYLLVELLTLLPLLCLKISGLKILLL